MKTSLVSAVAIAIAVILLLLGPTIPGGRGSVTSVPSLASDAGGPHFATTVQGGGLDRESSPSTRCIQGTNSITLDPTDGDMNAAISTDYQRLGQEGGGTLELGSGTFYINETLVIQKYSNVSIVGAGMGRTILSLPPDPVGVFQNQNGTPVGLYGTTVANFIVVEGPQPIDQFALCDLTLDAQAVNASEDWWGSLVFDDSGGVGHSYINIEERNLFGPSPNPNGLHVVRSPFGPAATDFTINGLVATNYTVPYENLGLPRQGGADFLGVAGMDGCTIDNVTAVGYVEFGLEPSIGCTLSNWQVRGHLLIDPPVGGSWGGTTFENDTFSEWGTAAINSASICVVNWTGGLGGSNFTGLRFVNDTFDGIVDNSANMVDVENSQFFGGLESLPSVFDGNQVEMNSTNATLPIQIGGAPFPALSVAMSGNTFIFPNGTAKKDPFVLDGPQNIWSNDTVSISGATNGYVLSAPGVALSPNSSFSEITYDSLGNGSPPDLVLLDLVGSPGFQDLGAFIGPMTRVYNDLPLFVPTTPDGLTGASDGPTQVALSWNASTGPLTNYTILVGDSATSLDLNYSVGVRTAYVVSDLAPGAAHFFSVEAWNFSFHSSLSSPIQVHTPPIPDLAPSVPTGLATTYVGTSEIGIHWNASIGNVTNYTVLAWTNASWSISTYSVGDFLTFTVTDLAPGTTYFLALQAWNFSWTSGPSAAVNATTLRLPTPVGPTPQVGPAPLSVFDWIVVLGTLAGTSAAVVVPLALISLTRTRALRRARTQRRPNRSAVDRL